MTISKKMRERFCKDCNIPIKLFIEPYFTDRLNLFDKYYGSVDKWNLFLKELEKYNNQQDYFEEYNKVKDSAILNIKNSEAYQKFNSDDMNKYRVKHENLPGKDIYKSTNEGKLFISIDMKKANFSSLKYYEYSIGESIFGGASTWEDFIKSFTDNKHIIDSKYIRQVILGNCNPRRHITYEKYLMDQVLSCLYDFVDEKRVASFSNDEIVYDMTSASDLNTLKIVKGLIDERLREKFNIPFSVELFTLYKIYGTEGYYKKIFKENGETNIEFKCLDNYMLPFVIRKFLGEEITDSDRVFYHEGLLAQFISIPEIRIN